MPGQGYSFVPLSDQVVRKHRPNASLDRVHRDCMGAVISVSYVALEPVHIGSGFWTIRGNHAIRGVVRSSVNPVIPGSSMKGVIRARYEAITKSCAHQRAPSKRKLDDKLPSRTYHGYEVEFGRKVQEHSVFSNCSPTKMCSACALFGMMSQRGRVSVRDLVVAPGTDLAEEELPKRFSPRPHHLGVYARSKDSEDKLVVHTLHGRKFHTGDAPSSHLPAERAEAIRTGTVISGKITCTNVTEAEFGGLLSALGIIPRTDLKIGAAKAYPFGRLALARLQVDVKKRPKNFDEDNFSDRVVAQFRASEDYWKDGERAIVEIFGRD